MEILYKIKANNIEKLRIKVDYYTMNNTIYFNNGKHISYLYLNQILINYKEGFVVFTNNLVDAIEQKEKLEQFIKNIERIN